MYLVLNPHHTRHNVYQIKLLKNILQLIFKHDGQFITENEEGKNYIVQNTFSDIHDFI